MYQARASGRISNDKRPFTRQHPLQANGQSSRTWNPLTTISPNKTNNIPTQPPIPNAYCNRMQLSDKRLAANRTNAKKSKGPVTPHGKCISSRNATRHGVLASVLLIEGESRERFNALLNGIYAEYQPVTPTEISLVNKIAASQWRQQRAWAIETASLTHEIRNQ